MSLATRTRLLGLAVALSLGFASIPSAFAEDVAPTTQRGAANSLEDNMKAMNRAFKTIGRQIDDASKDASTIKLAGDLEAATTAAKEQLPPQVEKLEGDAKTAAVADYRAKMAQSLADTTELKTALAAGKRDEAKAAYAKIEQVMKDGHKAYRVKR